MHRVFLPLAFTISILCAVPLAFAVENKYVGNKACQECHGEIYASWEKSIHAKAFDLLPAKVRAKEKKEAGLDPEVDFTGDKSCMRCHVTAWQEGGYAFDNPSDEWKGIGCEECHGAAERWLELHANKKLKRRDRKLKQAGLVKPFGGQSVCMRCHYNVNSPYKYRDPDRLRDWTDVKYADTYHILP